MKTFSALVSAILLLACLALPCIALESNVLTVSEKTLYVDLEPSFEIQTGDFNTSKKGLASQEFIINNTAAPGAAFVSIMSVYDEVMGKVNSSVLSELFLIGAISAVEARGDVEIGNWTAVNSLDKNVTIHTMSTDDERIEPVGSTYDIAVWNLDKSMYVVMTALLGRNDTAQMINTLAIK